MEKSPKDKNLVRIAFRPIAASRKRPSATRRPFSKSALALGKSCGPAKQSFAPKKLGV